MSEWWTYRLDDFLLFSPRVYWRMFELHNQAYWPMILVALAAGVILILLIALRPPFHTRWIAVILAVLWTFVGWSFVWQRYAAINWAAAYVAPAFALEAVMFLIAGRMRGALSFDRSGGRRWLRYVLPVFAIAGYPLLAPLAGRGWYPAEIFGMAPDPTAIATLGVLLLARGRMVPLLLPIPLIWCILSALTLHTMGAPEAWAPTLVVAFTVFVLAWRGFRRSSSSERGG
jgi:hypothetical protein